MSINAHQGAATHFTCGGRSLDLNQPYVMGVLNVTPDSFSDGGQFRSQQAAIDHALRMEDAGATFIDVGGESTRPGATPVSTEEELERTIPVIQALRERVSCLISIDSSTPEVFTQAAAAGAHLLNDVRALQRPDAIGAAAATGLPVCLMHMQGAPQTMQDAPRYEHVTHEVKAFLKGRIQACNVHGISSEQILIDPGFGFGKTLEQNIALFHNLSDFNELQCPMLIGVSRKSMIGAILDKDVDQRLFGSIGAAVYAYTQGARFLRVHDVAETLDALRVVARLHNQL